MSVCLSACVSVCMCVCHVCMFLLCMYLCIYASRWINGCVMRWLPNLAPGRFQHGRGSSCHGLSETTQGKDMSRDPYGSMGQFCQPEASPFPGLRDSDLQTADGRIWLRLRCSFGFAFAESMQFVEVWSRPNLTATACSAQSPKAGLRSFKMHLRAICKP